MESLINPILRTRGHGSCKVWLPGGLDGSSRAVGRVCGDKGLGPLGSWVPGFPPGRWPFPSSLQPATPCCGPQPLLRGPLLAGSKQKEMQK